MRASLEVQSPSQAVLLVPSASTSPDSKEIQHAASKESQADLLRNAPTSTSLDPLAAKDQPSTRSAYVWKHVIGFAFFFGSGLLASVAYLDPGNLEADIQLGVGSGFSLLWWTACCCMIFGFCYQCLSGRIGLVTGKDLAQHIGARYPLGSRIILWILIEIAIIGADIQETIGSSIGLAILTNDKVPLWAGCIIVSATAFLILLLERWGFRQLEAIFAAFIALEAICMGINFVQADIPSVDVARGFIPQLAPDTVALAAGALGALVMPYNIYFQSAVVNLRPRDLHDDAKTRTLINYLRVENFLVLAMAFVINLFVICVFADGFYGVLTEDEVGLESAGQHLADRFGEGFKTIWAVGLLASGQIATIGLTFAGQLVMSGLLNLKVDAGPRMMATRLVALVPTVTLAVVFEASQTFDRVAQLLNIVQSLVLPFALIPVIHIAADAQLLGSYHSHPALSVFAALVALVVVMVNGWTMNDFLVTTLPDTPAVTVPFYFGMALYFLLVLYYAIGPDHVPGLLRRTRTLVFKWYAYLRSQVSRVDWESVVEVHH